MTWGKVLPYGLSFLLCTASGLSEHNQPPNKSRTPIVGGAAKVQIPPEIIIEAESGKLANASWKPILDQGNLTPAKQEIAKAIGVYPLKISSLASKVRLVGELSIEECPAGGTYFWNGLQGTVWLADQRKEGALAHTFHHEFSSLLLKAFPIERKRLESAWPSKVYTFHDGASAVTQKKCSTVFDPNLAKNGFVCQYAEASFEEDVNCIAPHLFMETYKLDAFDPKQLEKFPSLKKKFKQLAEFYFEIDPEIYKSILPSIKESFNK